MDNEPLVASQDHEDSAFNVGFALGFGFIFLCIAIACVGCAKSERLEDIKPLAKKLNGAI